MTVHSYLRISTLDKGQTVENQRKAIKDAGYATDEWYAEEGVSGSVKALERPEFSRMMSRCTRDDIVIVTALDRLGRDAEDILHSVNNFERMGVKVIILALGNTDVTSVMGKAFVIMLSALAEMERNTLRERTRQGLARTKEEGTVLGRPLSIHPDNMKALMNGEDVPGVSRMTAYRNLKKWGKDLDGYSKEWEKRNTQYLVSKAA